MKKVCAYLLCLMGSSLCGMQGGGPVQNFDVTINDVPHSLKINGAGNGSMTDEHYRQVALGIVVAHLMMQRQDEEPPYVEPLQSKKYANVSNNNVRRAPDKKPRSFKQKHR
jgi:hypothetical protein